MKQGVLLLLSCPRVREGEKRDRRPAVQTQEGLQQPDWCETATSGSWTQWKSRCLTSCV